MRYMESMIKVIGSVFLFLILSLLAGKIGGDMLWHTFVRSLLVCFTFAIFLKAVAKNSEFRVHFKPQLAIITALLAVGVTILGDAVAEVYAYYSPEMVKDMESSFLYTRTEGWQAIIAGISLGVLTPIGEELFIRGVVYHSLRKSFSVRAAVILQAILFGALHMNLVQGTYAFLVGLLMGMIYAITNNLGFTILIHMINNISSFAAMRTGKGFASLPNMDKWLMTIGGCIICLGGIYLFLRETWKQMRVVVQKKEER